MTRREALGRPSRWSHDGSGPPSAILIDAYPAFPEVSGAFLGSRSVARGKPLRFEGKLAFLRGKTRFLRRKTLLKPSKNGCQASLFLLRNERFQSFRADFPSGLRRDGAIQEGETRIAVEPAGHLRPAFSVGERLAIESRP